MFRDESESPNDMYVDPRGCHYLLRPEAIESVYYNRLSARPPTAPARRDEENPLDR